MRVAQASLLIVIIMLGSLSPASGTASGSGAIPVEIVKRGERFLLLRDGKPYEVKGAGLEFSDVAVFASHGGNSIRTWRTDNRQATAMEVLDEAARNNVTVTLCVEIGRERHGFDYDDEQAVARQLEYVRGEVLKYKDHPALLVWMIGNEPNLHFKNPRVFNAINDISEMIHELDPNHPTTTALADIDANLVDLIEQRAPDLDFISVQLYGRLFKLPQTLEQMNFDKPYMVTEWGAVGHWEVPKTYWGAPIEQNSSEKAANYLKGYEVAIAPARNRLLGSYVFLWGQKQERTPTWYGMFLEDGTETETIDVMEYIWTGAWPQNRAPGISDMLLDSRNAHQSVTLEAGEAYGATVNAADPDGDLLRYEWEVMHESKTTKEGGDKEDVPPTLPDLVVTSGPGSAVLSAPEQPGDYRLFVYVYDDHGHAAHANIPFQVKK